jgi:hypothetical protein
VPHLRSDCATGKPPWNSDGAKPERCLHRKAIIVHFLSCAGVVAQLGCMLLLPPLLLIHRYQVAQAPSTMPATWQKEHTFKTVFPHVSMADVHAGDAGLAAQRAARRFVTGLLPSLHIANSMPEPVARHRRSCTRQPFGMRGLFLLAFPLPVVCCPIPHNRQPGLMCGGPEVGTCQQDDTCLCSPGYAEPDCSQCSLSYVTVAAPEAWGIQATACAAAEASSENIGISQSQLSSDGEADASEDRFGASVISLIAVAAALISACAVALLFVLRRMSKGTSASHRGASEEYSRTGGSKGGTSDYSKAGDSNGGCKDVSDTVVTVHSNPLASQCGAAPCQLPTQGSSLSLMGTDDNLRLHVPHSLRTGGSQMSLLTPRDTNDGSQRIVNWYASVQIIKEELEWAGSLSASLKGRAQQPSGKSTHA